MPREGGGARSCVIPPIYEKDSFTGTRVQKALEKGELPQTYIRKAVALVEAMESGAIEFKKELLPPQVAEILGINIDESTEVVQVSQVVVNENSETLTVRKVEIVEVIEIQHSIEAPSIPEVVAKLFACESYPEVQALMGALDTELKDQVWSSLNSDEMQHFRDLKAQCLDVVTGECELELPQDVVRVEEVVVETQNQYKSLIDLLPTLESCVGLKVVVSEKVKDVSKSLSDVYRTIKGKVGEITKKPNKGLVFVRFDFGISLTSVDWLEVIA